MFRFRYVDIYIYMYNNQIIEVKAEDLKEGGRKLGL